MQASVVALKKDADAAPGERARALIPELRKRAAEAEQLRRAPRESVELVRQAGLLRTILPRCCGGEAHSMRAHLDVISALAEGCSSTSWVVGVWHAHTWLMGHFSEEAQKDVYANGPDVIVSAVIAPRGRAVRQADGSFVLGGFWPFGSGCQHSQWLLLGGELFDEKGEKLDEGDFLVPTSAVEIKDDWFMAGLAGTGSNSIVAKDLKIPAHRFLSLPGLIDGKTPGAKAGDEDWLSRAQAVPVLALCLVGGSLGLARDALAEFKRAVVGKKVQYTAHVIDEWIPAQVALGHASAMIGAAELVAYKAADDIDDFARRGAAMPMEMRARIRMDCCYVVRTLMEAVDKLFAFAGASALSLRGSLQRDFRDLHATNLHGLMQMEASAEIYGRVLLGKEPNTPII